MTKPCCRKHKDFAARCGFVLAGERREDVRKEMRKEKGGMKVGSMKNL